MSSIAIVAYSTAISKVYELEIDNSFPHSEAKEKYLRILLDPHSDVRREGALCR